jgi:spermidine synthase
MRDPSEQSPPASDAFILIALCFFLSGFAALIYQTAWTRRFGFVFGTSELAIATVLAAYMLGLAAGAAAAGRLAPRLRRPVRAYGIVELGIALAALAVPLGIRATNVVYVSLFSTPGALPAEGGLAKALFYLAGSFAILLVPTGLMGATLPLLARHAVRRQREIGSHIGLLYAANTVGAVAGTVVTGFLLLPALGLQRTIEVAILVNALVFAAAVLLSRRAPPTRVATASAGLDGSWQRHTWVLPMMLVSGAVSFGYEVLWARLLGHLLGSSLYAFSTMLGTFLIGIALGAALAARIATEPARAARGLAWAQLGTAAFSLLAFALVDRLPGLFRSSGDIAWAGSAMVAAVTLLPSTLCIGATFPLAARILIRRPEVAGPGSARIYAWNTAGAVLGAVGAGFFLIPTLRYEGTLGLAVALNLLLAGLSPHLVAGASARFTALATAGLVLLVIARPAPPWNLLRSSSLAPEPAPGRVVYFGVGRSATVLLLRGPRGFHLRTNGLQEGDIVRRGRWRNWSGTVRWLCAMPSLVRPEIRSLLVIGLGAGSHLESAPSTLEAIDVVEIEPNVIAANRAVADARRDDPLSDPRVRLIANDARGALLLTRRRYDAIVSQPSHPWTAGASHLYTREFFQLVSDHLSDDGVFVQWMGLSHVDEELLRGVVATLSAAFPHVRVYLPDPEALLFVASPAPLDLDATAARALAAAPDDFAAIGIYTRDDVAAVLRLDEAAVREVGQGSLINTDDANPLETRSSRISSSSRGLRRGRSQAFFAPYDPLARPDTDVDLSYAVRRLLARGFRVRAQRLAEGTAAPVDRALRLGWVAEHDGRGREAERHFARALDLDPGNREARLALLRARRAGRAAGDPARERLAASLEGLDAGVVEGWRLAGDSKWNAVRDLEELLAAAPPVASAFPDAMRLRISWRLADGAPERAREALALVDELLPVTGALPDLVLRSRASAAVGDPVAALETLLDVEGGVSRGSPHRDAVQQALGLLAAILPDERTRVLHARLTASFERILDSDRH